MTVAIPPALHDVLGQRQTLAGLLAVGLAILAAAIVFATLTPDQSGLAFWRAALAALLFLDMAAGTVANFTSGTNAHYAQSPRRRWVFIAVHLHLPLFAALMGLPLAPFVLIWAYVIVTVGALNLAFTHPDQRVWAALVTVLGLMVVPILGLDPLGAVAAALFIVKLCYAFAVNHAGSAA